MTREAATCLGLVLDGVEGAPVTVEAHETFDAVPGALRICGLPDPAVKEGGLRLRIAMHPLIGDEVFKLVGGVLINLAPADLKKIGRTLDLPMAMAYAALVLGLDRERVKRLLFLGEIGLDGEVRPVVGLLAAMLEAKRRGLGVVCPAANLDEALLIEGPDVYPVRRVEEAFDVARGAAPPCAAPRGPSAVARAPARLPDLAEVHGQFLARRALEIAAAGGHNLLFEGPPGSGKTMLARRLPGVLPPLSDEEALEAALVRASVRPLDPSRFHAPAFRNPHHTASPVGLAGGGNPIRPGEVSLAHRGVLFLDELPEFRREALEVLREPMEERAVHVTRAGRARALPAHVLVVAAMNPCPCGFAGLDDGRCRCTPFQVRRYVARISGPLLDRFDLRVRLRPVPPAELLDATPSEASVAVRGRVTAARARQRARGRGALNAELSDAELGAVAALRPSDAAFYRRLLEAHRLSARGAKRLLRTARTAADLAGADEVGAVHLAEAASYRLGAAAEEAVAASAPAG
ncbi:MAG TPA: YifB family Mg chelatase-like AAA ATPase [Planctomycetota bacterium]|nr:YifB family Mg chelatase-like AAA ATPase [Planctomycetota bacterium]